jgi:hypothetical protein
MILQLLRAYLPSLAEFVLTEFDCIFSKYVVLSVFKEIASVGSNQSNYFENPTHAVNAL